MCGGSQVGFRWQSGPLHTGSREDILRQALNLCVLTYLHSNHLDGSLHFHDDKGLLLSQSAVDQTPVATSVLDATLAEVERGVAPGELVLKQVHPGTVALGRLVRLVSTLMGVAEEE